MRFRHLFAAALFVAFCVSISHAHPLALGRMELIVFPGHVTLWARVPVEQVIVQQLLPAGDNEKIDTPSEVYRKHGEYLLKHLLVSADGLKLSGKVISIQEPESRSVHPLDSGKEYATYEIEFPLAAPPALIEISQNVLNEVDFTPGNRWEATYVFGIRQDGRQGLENLYLTSKAALPFSCDWSAPPEKEKAAPGVENLNHAPPQALGGSVETPSDKTGFILGIAAGIAAVVMLVMFGKWRRDSGK